MAVLKTMTRLTKRNPVGWLVSQFWTRGERLDVVRVQFDGMTVAAVLSAVLAGKVVTFKNGATPELVFYLAAGYVVLMGLVNVILPSCRLCSFRLFGGVWMSQLGASLGAHLSKQAALSVFRHRFGAHWTGRGYRHTLSAHLVKFVKVMRSFLAHFALYAYASGISLQSGCARHASGILDRLSQNGYGLKRFTALAARCEGGAVARIANAIVSAVYSAFDAPILCHIAIIPQLPDLEKSR